MYAGANMGHPSRGVAPRSVPAGTVDRLSCYDRLSRDSALETTTIHWIFTHWSGMDTTIRHNNSNKGALVYGLSRA
jgi:hypothetical protein